MIATAVTHTHTFFILRSLSVGRSIFSYVPCTHKRRRPARVMRFVVDDQDVAGARQVAQHGADVGFVARGPALIHTPLPRELFAGLPVQRVPVADGDLALAQRVE